jgi:hypothetical protein
MENRRRIGHNHREVKIYKDYYRPSLNLVRFCKSILGVLIYGSTTVAHHYTPVDKKRIY